MAGLSVTARAFVLARTAGEQFDAIWHAGFAAGSASQAERITALETELAEVAEIMLALARPRDPLHARIAALTASLRELAEAVSAWRSVTHLSDPEAGIRAHDLLDEALAQVRALLEGED